MICPGPLSFRSLTEGQLKQVHDATLRVLEETGVIMDHPRAIEILSAAGCRVGEKSKVFFPPAVVEEAIRKAPETVTVYTRDGRP